MARITVADPPIKYAPDEPAELAYWHFDSLVAGNAKECHVDATTRAPMSERDAFKRIVRPLYDAIAELVDFAEGVAVGHDVPRFFANEAVNVSRLRSLLSPTEKKGDGEL